MTRNHAIQLSSRTHPATVFEAGSHVPDLRLNEVQVWSVELAQESGCVEAMRNVLSESERARVDRLVLDRHRHYFTVARGVLRTLLGAHVGVPPEQVCFEYGECEKPRLGLDSGGSDIRFNLSHSNHLALIAIARERELGIDLEQIRDSLKTERIAKRFFNPWEVRALQRLPKSERPRAFFEVWARKEAYVKARGDGLYFPFDEFCVSVVRSESPSLVGNHRDPGELDRWSLVDLDLAPGFAASLVAEGKGWHIRSLKWPRWLPSSIRRDPDAGKVTTATGGVLCHAPI